MQAKTLFVTDLDGTLLLPDQTLSEFTVNKVNSLIERGMMFTYATARSGETGAAVTAGLKVSAPKVLYNGALIRTDGRSGSDIWSAFDLSDKRIIDELTASGIDPIVYSVIDGAEKFSFVKNKMNAGSERFLSTRKHCVRYNPVADIKDLFLGYIFYVVCIDEQNKLEPFYRKYKDKYYCVYQRDIYSGDMWLEIMPPKATKASALAKLKQRYDCRLTVFGDGKNDMEMFSIADECYAMQNACEELKAIATAVIPSNAEDGIAKKLSELFRG